MKRLLITLAVLALGLAPMLQARPALGQSGNQWRIDYYNNPDWAGAPVYTQYANLISFNWGSDTPPGPNMPAQYWTARFSSSAFFYAGIYRFQIQADDDFALLIDGVTYADTRGLGLAGKPFTIDIPLTQNTHFVQVDYRQYTGPAYIFVNWTYVKDGYVPPPPPPAGPEEPFPPPSSLVTDFGDYTPCAQQQIHQSNCFVSNGAWDAPNLGSIQMEPQIVRWERCTPDTVQTMQLYINREAQSAACSKTQAGWFPR